MSIILTALITLVVGPLRASIYEWIVHKRVLHNPKAPMFLQKFFHDHARVHHMIFKFDDTYHVQNEDDVEIIDMKKWAWLLVLAGTTLEFIAALVVFFWLGLAEAMTIVIVAFIVSWAYYFAYEYLHYCMHLPKERQLELSWVFQKLNGHHLLHHRFMGKNFNVVFPFADWLFDTLLVRSPFSFKQAGPPTPNVQPLPES
jgi:hypothetical protein